MTEQFVIVPGSVVDVTVIDTPPVVGVVVIPGTPGSTSSWDDISSKPAVIAAGATQSEARAAIGAGTSNLVLGTTSATAKAGNYAPTSGEITSALGYTPAQSGHTHTKSDIGLGNVDNTADSTKAVATAGKWTTPRSIGGNAVDGSADVALSNKFIAQGVSDAGLTNAQFLGSLATGLVTNTATTGVLGIAAPGTDYLTDSDTDKANQLTTGESTLPRGMATAAVTLSTGVLRLTFFTASKTETIGQVRTLCAVAGTLATVCRIGIWSVAANGNLTLITSTANDTTLWSAATTTSAATNIRPLLSSWSKVRDARYAVGLLYVGTGTAPQLAGQTFPSAMATELGQAPRRCGFLTGQTQTELPASIAAASIADTVATVYVAGLP